MAKIDTTTKTIVMKVVYFGPPASGKSAALRHIYARVNPGHDPQRVSPEAAGPFYDYLPLQLGEIRGYRVQLDLFTTPPGDDQREGRGHLVADADGFVFVADCRSDRGVHNVASLAELQHHMQSRGFSLRAIPFVLQLNHADDPSAHDQNAVAAPLISWHAEPSSIPVHASVAPTGRGVFEALKSISRLCMMMLKKG